VSPRFPRFHCANSAQTWVLVLYADRNDALCSTKDLVIRFENLERQARRLEQERDAMEAKYEVCNYLALRLCS
jgi:hypothetical protein